MNYLLLLLLLMIWFVPQSFFSIHHSSLIYNEFRFKDTQNLIIKIEYISKKFIVGYHKSTLPKLGFFLYQRLSCILLKCTLVHALICCYMFSLEKHLEKFWKIFGRYIISMNMVVRKLSEYGCQNMVVLKRLQGIWGREVGIRILPFLGLVIKICMCLGTRLLLYHVESPQVGDVPIGLDLAAAYV